MSLVFDVNKARLYENWFKSSKGRAINRWTEDLLEKMIDPLPGERILDIGSGLGNHLLFLNRKKLDLSGIDASPYMISRARERLGNRCSLVRGWAEDLPYEDNEFDYAMLVNTLEFLDNPFQAIREAGRVARKKIFLVVLNSFSLYSNYIKMMGLVSESIFNYAKPFSLWEMKSYLRMGFGDAPISWQCSRLLPEESKVYDNLDRLFFRYCPFGAYIGISIDILYTVQTDQHPLKLKFKKTGQSIVNGISMKDN